MLFLGGRAALSDGGYRARRSRICCRYSPGPQGHVPPRPGEGELTPAGRDSLICRLVEQPGGERRALEEAARASGLPGSGRAEARRVVLAEAWAPAGVSRCWSRRTTAGAARRCSPRAEAGAGGCCRITRTRTHEIFWQQLLRWLVSDTPRAGALHAAPGAVRTRGRDARGRGARQVLSCRVSDARVEAHIIGPDGAPATLS